MTIPNPALPDPQVLGVLQGVYLPDPLCMLPATLPTPSIPPALLTRAHSSDSHACDLLTRADLLVRSQALSDDTSIASPKASRSAGQLVPLRAAAAPACIQRAHSWRSRSPAPPGKRLSSEPPAAVAAVLRLRSVIESGLVNAPFADDATPLMVAACSDEPAMIDILPQLLLLGVDVRAKTLNGETALHAAARAGARAQVLTLVASGACVRAQTVDGLTPAGLATRPDVVTYLRAAAAM